MSTRRTARGWRVTLAGLAVAASASGLAACGGTTGDAEQPTQQAPAGGEDENEPDEDETTGDENEPDEYEQDENEQDENETDENETDEG